MRAASLRRLRLAKQPRHRFDFVRSDMRARVDATRPCVDCTIEAGRRRTEQEPGAAANASLRRSVAKERHDRLHLILDQKRRRVAHTFELHQLRARAALRHRLRGRCGEQIRTCAA